MTIFSSKEISGRFFFEKHNGSPIRVKRKNNELHACSNKLLNIGKSNTIAQTKYCVDLLYRINSNPSEIMIIRRLIIIHMFITQVFP
jgi:hypothetical protein